mgnify:CR=1 FL=1
MGLGGALLARIQVDDAAFGGRNNFHLIRLSAALLVLLAHSFHLLARAGEEERGRRAAEAAAARAAAEAAEAQRRLEAAEGLAAAANARARAAELKSR